MNDEHVESTKNPLELYFRSMGLFPIVKIEGVALWIELGPFGNRDASMDAV
jgi:hypothetical protein